MPSAQDENGFGWTDPAWREEADAWIRERLGGDVVAEQPHVRPWATVLRVDAGNETVWFKACVPALAYELPLLEILGARRPDAVPHVIARDHERGWWILDDAGGRLVELDTRLERWLEFLTAYAQLQIDVAASSDELVDAGVPDSRTARMFADFEALLEDERNLRASPEDFVSREQVVALRALVPRLREHAARLDGLGVTASAQHDDLHQWNVFVRDGRYLFLDWGDACVSHPFLSLRVPFEHAVDFVDERGLERMRDAYLEPWTVRATRAELLAA